MFAGDQWGEIDTRFLYSAVNALSLIGQLHLLDVEKTVGYIKQCKNFDGGFGSVAGAESHAAQGMSTLASISAFWLIILLAVWVCTAALAILDRLDVIDQDTLGWWLAERQLPNGGLNGRPQKLEDVCYSQWVLSSLSILRKLSWIDSEKLIDFVLSAQVRHFDLKNTRSQDLTSSQDTENGGIADRPGDLPDVFHTVFGLVGELNSFYSLVPPAYGTT